jgi:undecaprenyl-diphosphatase
MSQTDTAVHHLGWLEAAVVGALQGVAELFPVSSLGHSVLLPALVGGQWGRDLDVSRPESPYLAFIVGLHVATALALLIYFRRDWVRIVGGLLTSVRHRRVATPDERLAWLLVLATIPVGLSGLLLEHTIRTLLAKPVPTAAFLMVNGVILLLAERYRRRADEPAAAGPAAAEGEAAPDTMVATDRRLSALSVRRAVLVGAAQIGALAPGISRSGVTMAAGLRAGLSHQDAARFSFLLATPVILAAGVLKLPDLAGPLGDGIRGQVLLGSVLSGIGAYLAVRFLDRYFATSSLRPFGYYCLAAGAVSLVLLLAR